MDAVALPIVRVTALACFATDFANFHRLFYAPCGASLPQIARIPTDLKALRLVLPRITRICTEFKSLAAF